MHQRNLLMKQIESEGLRIGDSCSIYPINGKKKAFTLNRNCIDLVSSHYRPGNLSLSYIELPRSDFHQFHYRLELDDKLNSGRFILRTLEGFPFWLNGFAAKEAYIERLDRLFIDENKINFNPFDLAETVKRETSHEILLDQSLVGSDLKILIQGETGTGKTHLARNIHDKSGRSGKFVSINLSSFNPQLIESELFGHKKGSFTGAINDKKGAFSEAQSGTLFLDEVDSLPLDLQTKLLSFLDSNSFRKVGDLVEQQIKTRLIFASGRPLETLVQQGLFRRDFYFRLKAGHTIQLSPLRNDPKRLKIACDSYCCRHFVSLSKRLSDFYETLAWPGNLRQLYGHLDKKRILTKGTKLDFDHLDEELLLQSSDLTSIAAPVDIIPMQEFKEGYVKKAFGICEGNLALTARKLKITEKTVKAILQKAN